MRGWYCFCGHLDRATKVGNFIKPTSSSLNLKFRFGELGTSIRFASTKIVAAIADKVW